MKQIIINSKIYGQKTCFVDDEDFKLISKFKWYISKSRNTFYARTNSSKKLGKQTTLNMHRLIVNAKFNELVDHRDGNGLNNQKSNLRYCSYSQNNANRKASGTSKYLGVYFEKDRNKWSARIRKNKKGIRLGSFDSEIEAAKKYNEAAILFHGEFARINSQIESI